MGDDIGVFSELIKNPVSWEVELTSRCNSRCVGCSRHSEYYYPNPYFDAHRDLKKETFFKALAATPEVDFILFCGNYGDPLLHPEIFEILDHIRENYGEKRILVHSNAAFGNEDFWSRLAKYFSTPGSYIKFSIDGLKDSHEKFRRGTSWERVLHNAETFIAAGGRAVWKMIEFEHNRHEIEKARTLSEAKGFRKFDLRKNNYPGLDQPIQLQMDLKSIPASVSAGVRTSLQLEEWNEAQVKEKVFDGVECKSLTKKNIYLDVYGKVWPCCWVGGLPYRPEHELRQWFQQKVIDRYAADFNSLEKCELKDIFKQSWFDTELEESWSRGARDKTNPLLSTCAKTCGKCRSA